MPWILGVDAGGTFTDLYAYNTENGTLHVHKTPSTPDNPAHAILDGLREICENSRISTASVMRIGHGTTVATNALIQRRGARLALITTRGFKDLLEIGRQIRPHLYDLKADYPAPLVSREHCIEIAERIGPSGEVLQPLADAEVNAAVYAVEDQGVEACAVCLLFSFINPQHEHEIGAALRAAAPGLHVSVSAEVQPEFREYERLSTTVLNAYLQPIIARYMSHLDKEISSSMAGVAFGINQSNGGLMSIDRARDYPVRTVLSGPAAGAVGSAQIARLVNRSNVIALDMGGTSADVSLIRNYEPDISVGRDVGGFPVRLPMIDVNTVGAGGGSIAWFDPGGLLKVGPDSAGANPGPACYGLGGDQPTVTDANLVLGRLPETGLLGGAMRLEVQAARKAIGMIANTISMSVEETARGVISIVVANMVRTIRAISIERGHDPRRFTLMAFGGAGPLHAADVARALGIREVLVPPAPGILCAQGLVFTDLKEDFVVSGRTIVDADEVEILQRHLGTLVDQARGWFETEEIPAGRRSVEVAVDMRYVGQNFELRVELGRVPTENQEAHLPSIKELKRLFFDIHEMNYGYHDSQAPVEVINLRLTARGRLTESAGYRAATRALHEPEPIQTRPVHFRTDGPIETPVFLRETLGHGHEIRGPAIIEQMDATTILHPGDLAVVDEASNLIMKAAQ